MADVVPLRSTIRRVLPLRLKFSQVYIYGQLRAIESTCLAKIFLKNRYPIAICNAFSINNLTHFYYSVCQHHIADFFDIFGLNDLNCPSTTFCVICNCVTTTKVRKPLLFYRHFDNFWGKNGLLTIFALNFDFEDWKFSHNCLHIHSLNGEKKII